MARFSIHTILQYAVFIFALALLTASGFACAKSQKVLVLHSYHQGLEWTDSISEGIKSVFAENDNGGVEIYFEYLDTKRNTGEDYSEKLLALFRAKEHRIPFNLIITSDNNALEFIRKHGAELYPDTPVVFSGVNFFRPELTYGIKQVTGVVEKADVKGTLELMLSIHPEKKKVLILLDETPTGFAIRKTVEAIEHHFTDRIEIEYYTVFTWSELEEKISSLGTEYLVYLLALNRDKNNEFQSYIDSIELIKRSASVPVYGSWDFYLGKGIIGGVIISGFTQGRIAAELAKQILSGTPAHNIPIVYDVENQPIFDYPVVERWGVKPSSLPGNVSFINRPPSLWEQLRTIPGWLMAILSVSFAALISVLVIQKAKQRIILQNNVVLDHKVREKTEELNSSNDRLNTAIEELEQVNIKLNEIAITDALTGIYNRRHISERFEEEYSIAARYKSPFSILMLDIDHFKSVNDTYGHQYGDVVLYRVAQAIKSHIREGDVFGRYGGEEFLLLLPHTNMESAHLLADRIRHDIEKLKWDQRALKVTISGGVAEYMGQSEDALLQHADACLYSAKEAGRNRIIC